MRTNLGDDGLRSTSGDVADALARGGGAATRPAGRTRPRSTFPSGLRLSTAPSGLRLSSSAEDLGGVLTLARCRVVAAWTSWRGRRLDARARSRRAGRHYAARRRRGTRARIENKNSRARPSQGRGRGKRRRRRRRLSSRGRRFEGRNISALPETRRPPLLRRRGLAVVRGELGDLLQPSGA